jgi:hypothetical protein
LDIAATTRPFVTDLLIGACVQSAFRFLNDRVTIWASFIIKSKIPAMCVCPAPAAPSTILTVHPPARHAAAHLLHRAARRLDAGAKPHVAPPAPAAAARSPGRKRLNAESSRRNHPAAGDTLSLGRRRIVARLRRKAIRSLSFSGCGCDGVSPHVALADQFAEAGLNLCRRCGFGRSNPRVRPQT